MKFAFIILNALLDRFERSALSKKGVSRDPGIAKVVLGARSPLLEEKSSNSETQNRRWMEQPESCGKSNRKIWFHFNRKNLPAYFDDTSARPKSEINETCLALAARGLLEIRWVKHEEGNLVEKVALNGGAVEDVYRCLGRKPKLTAATEVCALARSYSVGSPSWAVSFFEYIIARFEYGESVSRYLDIWDIARAELLFKTIRESGRVSEETPRRIFSQKALGHSKAFDSVAGALTRVVRDFHPAFRCGAEEREGCEQKEVLAELGLVDNPQHLLISGPLRFTVDGRLIDISAFFPDIGLPAEMVSKMVIEELRVDRVVTVENLTSYYQFARHHAGRFLVIYLGGYHNSPRRLFLTRLRDHLVAAGKEAVFYHWGDIDYGGFTIFNHLRSKCSLNLIPLHMDVTTLQRYEKFAMPFDRAYGERLSHLLDREEYHVFHDVIHYMLERKIRLEQECVEVEVS